jgi:hypothetical protein
MNVLNFSQLKNELQLLIDRNATATLTWLGNKINDAYIDLGNAFRFDSLRRTAYLTITAPYTTGTVAVDSQSAAVTGTTTAFTKTMEGQTIVLNGQAYKILTVTDGTHLTLDRPYEGTSAITADATAIYYDAVKLPYGCDYPRIEKIIDPKNQNSLRSIIKDKFDSYFPNPTTAGNPVIYTPTGYLMDRYPASGTAALAASSNTTTAIFPTGPAAIDDHYNDWNLINTTREAVSRVTDYAGSTLTATIAPAIAAQVATDACYMEKCLPYINIYPLPDSAQTLIMTYYKLPNKMVNDYDIPFDVPERYQRAIYLRAAVHSNLIRDDSRINECKREYEEYLTKMNEEFNDFAGEEYPHGSIDGQANIQEFNEYKFPLGS